ncbi:hypothetical protein BC360_21345 [Ensifer sp. LC163]|nr:hypothetical protein BC360_21345 [Ensifer sp. LC163]
MGDKFQQRAGRADSIWKSYGKQTNGSRADCGKKLPTRRHDISSEQNFADPLLAVEITHA